MELTKEYFDSKLEGLATKVDLDATEHRLREAMVTKSDIEDLASSVSRGFDEVYRRLDVQKEVQELQAQMHQVREELNRA